MALCKAYQFFLLIGVLGSFRSDVVNGQGGTTTQGTSGDSLTTSVLQTTTPNAGDKNVTIDDSSSTTTTTALTTSEVEFDTNLTTLFDTTPLEPNGSSVTDVLTTFDSSSDGTSETVGEGSELETDSSATTIFKTETKLWNNEGTDWTTVSDGTATPTEINTEKTATTLPPEFTTVVDDRQESSFNDNNDGLTTYASYQEYSTEWSTESSVPTTLSENDTTDDLTTLSTEVVTDIESDMQHSTSNGDYNDMHTTTRITTLPIELTTVVEDHKESTFDDSDDGMTTYASHQEHTTELSTQSSDLTTLPENGTTEDLTTLPSEVVTDITSDMQHSTSNSEYNDMHTTSLEEGYVSTWLTSSDETTALMEGSTSQLNATLHTESVTNVDSTLLVSILNGKGDGSLNMITEIVIENVVTNLMDTMSTEIKDEYFSETTTSLDDLTTPHEDGATSLPSMDAKGTEFITILYELSTDTEMADSTKSDDNDDFATEYSPETVYDESTTFEMQSIPTEKGDREEEAEEDEVTEIMFTEEYASETSSNEVRTGNESSFRSDSSTDHTLNEGVTKDNDKNTFNSALSETTIFPFTTETLAMLDNTVSFLMRVDVSINITKQTFIDGLEQGLSNIIQTSSSREPSNAARRKRSVTLSKRTLTRTFRRQRRSLNDDMTVTVTNLARQTEDPEIVKTRFTVDVNGTTLNAADAASLFDSVSESKLSAALGYEVISKPVQENLPETSLVSLGPLETPSGDLQDFLMITLLVPLNIDISGALFQTDIAHGLESIYLAGMELLAANTRKKRRVRVLLDGRVVQMTERDGIRRRRQAIEDPSEEYVVKLKSVNRPDATKMEVDIVFCVAFNDQVLKAGSALEKLEELSLSFMTTVLGYQVKEPGVTLFKNHGNSILWVIIIIADVAVIAILLFILVIYCCCIKAKRAEVHKQAVMSKVDRATSIEMGFVRIGVQSSDQVATTQRTKKHKSGAHMMHGTTRDKVNRKRHRKQGAFIQEYRLGGDSSSDEESQQNPHLVKPSQIISHNRVHPDVSALVPYSGTEDDYEKQEYIRRFKKKDADEEMRRQQLLQEQLNKEMAARLGAASGEDKSLRSQIGELLDGAANLNVTDRKSSSNRKKKKKKNPRKDETEILVEDSGNRKKKMKKKTVVLAPEVATKVTHQKKTIQRENSYTKPAFEEVNDNKNVKVDQEILYRELCRKWKKERKRLNKFIDEAFIMTTSLLDNSQRIPSSVKPLQRSPVGEEISSNDIPTNRKLPAYREIPTYGQLPPMRQTPLTVGPFQPNPYLYHHSVGIPNYFPLTPSQTQDPSNDPYLGQIYAKQLKEEQSKHPKKSKENGIKNKVDWTHSLTKCDDKSRHVPPKTGDSIKKRKSRQDKYS